MELPRTYWWLGLAVVPVQGWRLSRTIERFADADGTSGTVGDGPVGHRVVALGDSVTAGYALAHHRDSVAGQLAARLADRDQVSAQWTVLAKSGATAGGVLRLLDPAVLAPADVVFLSVGVNDLKDLHPAARYRRELGALLDATLAAAPRATVCLLGIPPLDHFPAFPRPLADALGWRGRVFDAIGAEEVARRDRATRIRTDVPLGPEMFAADGFHPSERLHAAFADAVLDVLPPRRP